MGLGYHSQSWVVYGIFLPTCFISVNIGFSWENHRTKSWVFRTAIFDYLRVILPGAIRKTASIQDSGDFLHRQRVLSSRQRNQNLFGECHRYGPWLLVITGYFYWIIHPINDVLLVLITGISGQNCRDRFSSHWFGKSGRREIPAAAWSFLPPPEREPLGCPGSLRHVPVECRGVESTGSLEGAINSPPFRWHSPVDLFIHDLNLKKFMIRACWWRLLGSHKGPLQGNPQVISTWDWVVHWGPS